MANEITLTISATITNGDFKDSFLPGAEQITQTTLGGHSTVWTVGTSEEDLVIGDVGTLGLMMLRNLDSTNYVQIGKKVAGAMEASMRLSPGIPMVIKSEPGITWTAKANTASCKVLVKIWEL